MVIGGYSFTNLVHDVESTASDPRVQQAAVAAVQAYNPQAYNQATAWADRARGYAPMPMMPPGPVPIQVPPGTDVGVDNGVPVHYPNHIQENNWLPWLVVGGLGLGLIYLITQR